MIQFLIAILLGLACYTGNTTNGSGNPKDDTEYNTMDDETGGDDGDIPPPPPPPPGPIMP